MTEEGYINLESGQAQMPGATYDVTGAGDIDEAKQAAQQVNFNLTQKGVDFLGYRALKGLLGALGKSNAGSHDTPHLATGIEAEAASRPYEFGDTMNLDIPATLKNAIEREGLKVPLNLDYSDLMVHQSEFPLRAPPFFSSHKPLNGPLWRDRSCDRVVMSHMIGLSSLGHATCHIRIALRKYRSHSWQKQVGHFTRRTRNSTKDAAQKNMRQIIMIVESLVL